MIKTVKMKKPIFESPFKFCPECGNKVGFNEDRGRNCCGGCGLSAMKMVKKFSSFYDGFEECDYEDYFNAHQRGEGVAEFE
jgi:ribosomal protein S27AE